jgi:lipopolysaccharide transport system permease protein
MKATSKKNSSVLVITAGRTERHYWKDLWTYRELFYILSWRDIKVRYKQTVIGALWSIIRPLLTMIVFTVVFGRLANLNEDAGNAPYAIMVFAALLPWQFFSNALTEASNSLISNTNLISKVYFPRLIIPTASVITSLIDFLIAFLLLGLLLIYYRFVPSWQVIYLPFFLLIAFVCSMGVGLWLTAMNVKYRDFRYIVPFIVQFGLYISPVGFSSERIPQEYRMLYNLNPIVGIIDGFRWCILGSNQPFPQQSLLFSVLISAFFLWLGIRQFRKMEKSFADLI